MKKASEILEGLSPFWDKYTKNHTIFVKKEETLELMEAAEKQGFGVELWEYTDKTIIGIFDKTFEDLGGVYIRFFKDGHNEIETRLSEAKSIAELQEMIKLLKFIDGVTETIGDFN